MQAKLIKLDLHNSKDKNLANQQCADSCEESWSEKDQTNAHKKADIIKKISNSLIESSQP